MRKLFAGLALLCVSAAEPASLPIQMPYYAQVHQVVCAHAKGTAFRVSDTEFLSVNHVTSLDGCAIDGEPIQVEENNEELDFSRLHTAVRGRGLKINCEGFKPGQYYFAVGFAHGWALQTTILLYATYADAPSGMRILLGKQTVIPGQSGGPILNTAGEVVGLVNAYNPLFGVSLSRALKDTDVCKS